MTQRRGDFTKNLELDWTKRSGCTWCGVEGFGCFPQPEYCSDTCLQLDMQGIDDRPPVIVLADDYDSYVQRKWGECV